MKDSSKLLSTIAREFLNENDGDDTGDLIRFALNEQNDNNKNSYKVFHGTQEKSIATPNNSGLIFLTDNYEVAKTYTNAKPRLPIGNVYHGILYFENPFTIDANNSLWHSIPFMNKKLSTDDIGVFIKKNNSKLLRTDNNFIKISENDYNIVYQNNGGYKLVLRKKINRWDFLEKDNETIDVNVDFDYVLNNINKILNKDIKIYDGVVIKNVIDDGGKSKSGTTSTVYISFDKKNFKNLGLVKEK